jgi:alginate O-acetyltransferase complex protein AlgI
MLFSSTIFLFAFLPVVLCLYWALPGMRSRNALLLLASLLFYAWGEAGYVLILLASIGLNWAFGLWIDARRNRASERLILAAALGANLLLLGVFKYANFLSDNLNEILSIFGAAPTRLDPIHLPIGISFFTFQAITYLVDVHRGEAPLERSPFRVALYIALFPQLIAGPIVRYRQVAAQLVHRHASLEDLNEGVRRFILGLGKKVLVANTLALPADRIFAIPPDQLEPATAWLGLTCFTFQIYFDFSGYSDMAIGLGRCFGFRFPENFNWPYRSRSMREFWRRWHMTLSSFFRDYVYIPLRGNRGGLGRTYANLLIIFLLCGLWHGASWTFVVWGLIHGAFLIVERTRAGDWIRAAPRRVQSLYVLSVAMVGWVFFRSDDLAHAIAFLSAMVGGGEGEPSAHPVALYWNAKVGCTLAGAALSTTALPAWLAARFRETASRHPTPFAGARIVSLQLVLLLCAMSLAAGTHNPFIYFRF